MGCNQCGVCCKLFLINLTEEEYKSERYSTMFDEFVPDFEEAEMVGANILKQKEDGSCVYLKDGKCHIHNFSPASCKKFFCDSSDPSFKGMIEKIKDYKNNQSQ